MPKLTDGATRTPVPSADVTRAASRSLVGGTQDLIAGVTGAEWFGPGQPLPAIAPPATEPRALDYQFAINTQLQTRRTETGYTYQQLRALARNYDLLRLVIETRKDQVAGVPLTIRVRKQDGETFGEAKKRNAGDPRVRELTDFFRNPDGSGWQCWIRKALEDVFVVDALSILPRWTITGKIGRLEVIDGATIDRKIDPQGRTPEPPSIAYQQILKGVPAIDLTAPIPFALRGLGGPPKLAELVYRPRNVVADRLYGFAPVEQIVTTVNIALRRQMSQLAFYTDGNINDALISVDDSWGAEEIKRFQSMYDETGGQLDSRRRARFLPPWKSIVFPRAQVLKDEFDEWLARVVCYAFSVSYSWAVKQNNRATAQQAAETADEEGLQPILDWVSELLTYLIATFWGYADIEATFQDKTEPDPLKRAQVHQIYLDEEVLTRNEVREELGRDPLDGGDEPEVAPVSELPPTEKLAGRRRITKVDPPPKDLAVSPDQDLPGRATAEANIEAAALAALNKLREDVAAQAEASLTNVDTADALTDALDLSALDLLAEPAAEAIGSVATAAAGKALRSLDIDSRSIFDMANERAAAYARTRAAELVGRKWVGDKLVDNPDARWAISDSTREKLREMVAKAFTDGMTPAELAGEIRSSTAFSEARAKVIAKTETSMASIRGTVAGWIESGVVEKKQSLLSDDHEGNDECDQAAADEAIPVDETFSTGDDGPPYHPGCNCSLAAVLTKD